MFENVLLLKKAGHYHGTGLSFMRLIITFALTFISKTSFSNIENKFIDYSYLANRNDYEVVDNNLFGKDSLSFNKIKKSNVRSYDEMLRWLKRKRPVLFENEILIHRSGSLQPASKEHPRVILFDKRMIFSFSSQPYAQKRIEILEFDPKKKAFNPREIIFEKNKVKYVSNPTSCIACHGRKIKPIWAPYDFWPNVYGGHIGRIAKTSEYDAYKKAFEKNKEEGIFKYISIPKDMLSRYIKDVPYSQSVEAFALYITQLNNFKLAQEIVDAKLGPFLYPVIFALKHCFNKGHRFEAMFSGKLRSQMPMSYKAITKDTLKARQWLKLYQASIYGNLFRGGERFYFMDHNRLEEETKVVSMLRYVFENNGLSLREHLLNRGINDYFFSTPSNFSFDLYKVLERLLPKPFVQKIKNQGPSTCKAVLSLAKKELNFPEGFRPKAKKVRFHRVGRDLLAIGKCLKCHTLKYSLYTRGPYIPFDDTLKLKKLLKTTDLAGKIISRVTSHSNDVMPPQNDLNSKEKLAIIELIETLKNH